MRLPIDIPQVFKAATDIKAARDTPLSMSIYIDESAPGDVIGQVRAAFTSAAAATRVTITYFDNEIARPDEGDDIAVIVAGFSERVGLQAKLLREAGVPVMIATTMPSLVNDAADAFGTPIPDGDIVSPDIPLPKPHIWKAGEEGEPDQEPLALNQAGVASFDRRVGQWIITTCSSKKLAFALSFPFVRKPLALDAVDATAIQNAAIGAIPIVPGANMPLMTLNQAKMMLQIAASYGEPLGKERIKELAAMVGGAFLFRGVARKLSGFVPVLGWAINGVVGYTGTQAIGHAAIDYFEAGGDIKGIANIVESSRDALIGAVKEASSSDAGTHLKTSVRDGFAHVIDRLRNRA